MSSLHVLIDVWIVVDLRICLVSCYPCVHASDTTEVGTLAHRLSLMVNACVHGRRFKILGSLEQNSSLYTPDMPLLFQGLTEIWGMLSIRRDAREPMSKDV